MGYEVRRYREEEREVWDHFVSEARNATFLFMRDYIDYHADRFTDCSWMVWKGSRLMALLPANITPDGILHSHQGLTYGGWILPFGHINASDLLDIFTEAIAAWREMGITALDYKPIPSIYCATPSDDAEYALFRLGASLTEANVSSTLPLPCNSSGSYNKLRKRALAKASGLDFQIRETDNAAELMDIVADCLRERHNAVPVHTAAEMQHLKACFPEQIRFFLLDYAGSPQAAVCIYDTGRVAHAQYIASTPLARDLNLLTPLFHHLISDVYASRAYFDFGTSNEDHGRYLNAGLLRQKASYGATALLHRRFTLPL